VADGREPLGDGIEVVVMESGTFKLSPPGERGCSE
jgi:hypothetical protein